MRRGIRCSSTAVGDQGFNDRRQSYDVEIQPDTVGKVLEMVYARVTLEFDGYLRLLVSSESRWNCPSR